VPNYLLPSSFNQNGFMVIKNVLLKDKVSDLREKLLGDVRRGFKGAKGIDYVLGVPELYEYQFSQSIVRALQSVFGSEVYYLNDLNLQFNNPDNRGKSAGWHIDANSELGRFVDYLFHRKYKLCKVGVYLQDNSFEFGGGIDVEIGGHKSFRDMHSRILNLATYELDREILSRFRRRIRVPIEAGDCVIFDSRLPHASSPPRMQGAEIPKDNLKITLYWDVAGSEEDARLFYTNSTIRAFTDHADSVGFFTNYLRYHFPDSYPESYVNLVNNLSSIRIFSLDKTRATFFDELHQQSVQGTWVQDDTGSVEQRGAALPNTTPLQK
jgi:hypothetical protein